MKTITLNGEVYQVANLPESLLNMDRLPIDFNQVEQNVELQNYVLRGYHCYDSLNTIYIYPGENLKEDTLIIGAELETEYPQEIDRDSVVSMVRNLFYGIECTDDGSLHHGIEFVFPPMTLKAWQSLKPFLKLLFNELSSIGGVSDESSRCGLHFHVNRLFLGDDEKQHHAIDRLNLLAENFKDELINFSRRGSNRGFCNFISDVRNFDSDEKIGKIKKLSTQELHKVNGSINRYKVFNDKNTNTIEFRLCKGSLNIQTFYASLELYVNLLAIVKDWDSLTKNNLTWKKIIELNSEFKDIKAYNARRGIKSNKRLKDYSEKLAIILLKQDRLYTKEFKASNKILKAFSEFLQKNYKILNYISCGNDCLARLPLLDYSLLNFDPLKKLKDFKSDLNNLSYNIIYNYRELSTGDSLQILTDTSKKIINKFIQDFEEVKNYVYNCN